VSDDKLIEDVAKLARMNQLQDVKVWVEELADALKASGCAAA
jgi:hypothetical protein